MGRLLSIVMLLVSSFALANKGDGPIPWSPSGSGGAIKILKSKHGARSRHSVPDAVLKNEIASRFDVSQYREIKGQLVYNTIGEPDHVLVSLHSKTYHRMDYATIAVDSSFHFSLVRDNYRLRAEDLSEQVGINAAQAQCPDPSVEFIAICPNDNDLELQVTKEVADAAKAANLKVVELYKEKATHDAWLNYMACPKVKGNFYDGDANTSVIAVNDGEITADEFSTVLKEKFRYQVTNIWLACEAYNDPMLTAVQSDAQSKKYAAGINDLQVGPSDKAAACAMEAAVQGKPMTDAFQNCYKTLDTPDDHWGFGGKGSDNFFDSAI